MKLLDVVREVRRHLEENGRVSLRMLRRQYELDDEALGELIEELVDVQRIARREENVLVWSGTEHTGGANPTLTPNPVTPNPLSETRKVISIIFADLMGSTALQEGLDPESVNRVMDAYYQSVRGPVEAAGGTVVQLLGDGVLCAFGIPRIGEDDALRAVRAAVGIQQAFREFLATQQWLRVPIGLRVAVNTGEVVVSEEHPAGIGDPLNVAARLQQEARDGEVVIGQATRRLVADAVTLEQAGTFALKGRAGTVTAYRVISLERPAGAITAAFVGRDDELARIAAVYDAARATPAARLAVVLGSPGLGKSRLIEEVARRLGDAASVVTAQCDAAGGATFAPVAAALRTWLGAGRADQTDRSDPSDPTDPSAALAALVPEGAERARIITGITALLAGSPASPEETFFVIRRFLTALAQNKPVVLVIDDLHWAEPLLLDLVEHLVQWGSGVPLFVLVGGRPELRDLRSSLATPGGFVSDVVTLSGLDAGAAMRLAANVIGASDLPAAVIAKVLATSEGNPLFVGELVRMLVDEGAIERQGERWIVGANLAALEMPPTIHALLAARIERLRPEERMVLERASVVGRHFSRSAVAALLGCNGNELDARLEALQRGELIERDSGWFLGEPVLRFHHVLIRDAAYRRLLKGTRAELHARFAEWVAAHAGEADHDETIGWHLEQAHQLLRELGPLDAAGRGLGEQAAHHLAAAGRRALGRDDLPVAADLLGRAINCLDTADEGRADLALDWCEALLSAGDVGRAANAIAELGRFAGANDRSDRTDRSDLRLRAWHTCFASQLTVLTAPQGLQAAADAVAEAAQQLAAQGDAAGEAKAHSVHAQALARLGKVGAAEAALDQALAAARRAGDRRRANAVLAGAPLAALWGPSPVTRASGRCLDVVRVLRITQGAPAVESVALSCQGVLEALRGRTVAARRMLASSRKMVEDLGIANRLFEADAFAGRIAAMEGDTIAAERLLRGAYEGLRNLGLGIDAARAGALLARTLLAQDRAAEAEALSHESEALAGDDLQAAIAWRGVRAEALAKRGEHAAAVELAKAAVAIASATDALLDHADARVALGIALRAAGRGAEADAEERRAIELWEAKGATLLAERARTKTHRAEPVAAKAAPSTEPAARRRVRPNAGSTAMARVDAALAARALDAIGPFAESFEEVSHPTGTTYGRDAMLLSIDRFLRLPGAKVRHELLATLGETLWLFRRWMGAAAAGQGRFDVGAYEKEEVGVNQIDPRGAHLRNEIFAPDHLADAIVLLFQRYAELLPEGPGRDRATATAGSIERMYNRLVDRDHLESPFSAAVEWVDHRVAGVGTLRGDAAVLAAIGAFLDLVHDARWRVDDVLVCTADALLTRSTNLGTDRASGGAFERQIHSILAFDADGRIARWETFDADREAEALTRFDALTAHDEPKRPARRRVRSNAATAMQAHFDAALAARDFAAIAALFHEEHQEIDHPTGSTYGRDACTASLQRLFRSRDPFYQVEPLAALGDLLLLIRRRSGAAGTTGARYDVGAYANEAIQIFEVDASGRCRRAEVFAADHLGDAIVRLYERYAELLPDTPSPGRSGAQAALARTRAVGVARSIAAWNGPVHLDHLATVYAPSLRHVDHRFLGTWSARDAAEILGHFRLQLDLSPDFAGRYEDVFAVAADALVVRMTFFGIARDSGGPFENRLCVVFMFGADGRVTQTDVFEAEQEAEALACFDELTGGTDVAHERGAVAPGLVPAERGIRSGHEGRGYIRTKERVPLGRRRVRANAATRGLERFESVLRARDGAALKEVFHESLHVVHHSTRATYGRREMLGAWRSVIKAERFEFRSEILASLGGGLALEHHLLALEGLSEDDVPGIGRAEFDEIALVEADDRGRWLRCEIFAAERAGDAIACLYERHAALLPEGPGRERAVTTAHAAAAMLTRSLEHRLEDFTVSDLQVVDHRTVGTVSGRDVVSRWREVSDELTQDQAFRVEEVLALSAHGLLRRTMQSGTVRASGGPFETSSLALSMFGHDGRLTRFEVFEIRHEAEALARFDALVGDDEVDSEIASFDNAASRSVELLGRRWAARDWVGVVAILSPALRFDDRRRMMRLEIGYGDFVAQFRMLFDQPESRWHESLLATRGERLALTRTFFAAEVAGGGGPLALDDHISLTEVDGDGRWLATVIFDLDDLDAAYDELDARYYAGEGAAHPAHGAIMRAFTRAVVSRDWDPVLALCAPEFIEHDHRSLAVLGTTRGAAAWVQNFSTLVDLAPDTVYRVDHLRSAAHGFCSVGTWIGSRDGGRYEIPLIAILELDDRDRLARADIYDPDQMDQALARFEEVAAAATTAGHWENSASRAWREVIAAWRQRDLERFAALQPSPHRYRDHRRLFQLDLDREGFLEFTRPLLTMRSASATLELLATRGERLALMRFTLEMEDEVVGPSAIDSLLLIETAEQSAIAAYDRYELDDLDAAYAELDARFEAGEGAAHGRAAAWSPAFRAAVDRRNWDAAAELFAPAFIGHDHRLVGWGTRRGAAAYLEALRAMVDLAPDVTVRRNHVRASSRALLLDLVWLGTRDGGAFESPFVAIVELDDSSRALRMDLYDPQHLDRAQARFAELAAEMQEGEAPAEPRLPAGRGSAEASPSQHDEPFANAATASAAPVIRCLIAHDWEGFRQLFAEGFHMSDRRRVVQLELDRDQYVAFTREVADGRTVRNRWDLLATRGECLAVTRAFYELSDADVGPSEIAFLILMEVDERGRIVANVRWDLADVDAAYAELDARYEAGEAAGHDRAWQAYGKLLGSVADRDWDALASSLAPHFAMQDHRVLGWGSTLGDPFTFVRSQQALFELSPDYRYRPDHVRMGARATLTQLAELGTREGGPFENCFLWLGELDERGRYHRFDLYDLDQVDAALTRFDEIHTNERRDPLAAIVKGHAATAWLDGMRVFDVGDVAAADWDALRASCAPGMIFEDRQGFARLSGDREMMIASLCERVASGARSERRLLGTAGERVAIMRMLWTGGPADGRFEIEYLSVVEIDASGLVSAIILFGAADALAAKREAWARWAAIDPVAAPWVEQLGEITDAWNSRDASRIRAIFADDVVLEDHRHAGLGRIEGMEAWGESTVVLWTLAPDQRMELGWSWPVVGRHGFVVTAQRVGTLAEGGAFESEFIWLGLAHGGRLTRVELFEIDAIETALVRFEELRSPSAPGASADMPPSPFELRGTSPLRIPPNAATRVLARWEAAVAAGDEAAVRAFYASSYRFEDHRRLFRTTVDVEGAVANDLQISAGGWRSARTLLATAGDRLALQHVIWTMGETGATSEIEVLALAEVDVEGRFVRTALFDPDGRAVAQAKLFERYVASGGDGLPRGAIEYSRGLNGRDLVRARTGLCDDFVLEDHRRTGMGHLESGDAYIASVAAAYELTRELTVRPLYVAAIAPHGRVVMVRVAGTNAEGGAFEFVYAALALYRGERIASFEFFEPEDLDVALARLAECGDTATV